MVERESLVSLLVKGINSTVRVLTSGPHLNLIISQSSFIQILSHRGLGLQHVNFGDKVQYIVLLFGILVIRIHLEKK